MVVNDQCSFGVDRILECHLLALADQSAKWQKLKVWKNYIEGQAMANSSATVSKQKLVLKVKITDVVRGGRFNIQAADDQLNLLESLLLVLLILRRVILSLQSIQTNPGVEPC